METAAPPAPASTAPISQTEIEDVVASKNAKIEEMKIEIATLKSQLRSHSERKRDTDLNDSVRERITSLENKIAEQQKEYEELEKQAKGLRLQLRAKDTEIDRLGKEIEARAFNASEITRLQNELRYREQEMAALETETKTLRKIQYRKDAELVRLAKIDDDSPFSYRAWQSERESLKAEIKRLRDNKLVSERQNKAQQVRIEELEKRIGTLAGALLPGVAAEPLPPTSPQSPRPATAILTGRTATPVASPPSSPLPPSSAPADATSAEGESVPVALYRVLERKVQELTRLVQSKEDMMVERDDMLEVRTRANDVLAKGRQADEKRLKTAEAKHMEEVLVLRQELETTNATWKERERQLKEDLLRTKDRLSRLTQQQRLEREGVSTKIIDRPPSSPAPAASTRVHPPQ